MELRKARIVVASLSFRFVLFLHDMGLSNPLHLPKSRHHLSQRMAHSEAPKCYERPCNICGKKGVRKKCEACSVSYHNKCGHTYIPVPQQPNLTPIPNYNIVPTLLLLKAPSKVAACHGLCGHPTAVAGLCGCTAKQCGCGHHFDNFLDAGERQQHSQLSKKHKAWIAPSAPSEPPAKAGPMDRFVNVFCPQPPPKGARILCPPPPPPTLIPANLEMPSEAGPARIYKCRGTVLGRSRGWPISNYPHMRYVERHLHRWRCDMVPRARSLYGQG